MHQDRKSTKDDGFTLMELLIVMVIIGVLASIAIPVFSNAQRKAEMTALQADANTIRTELMTYAIDASDQDLYTMGLRLTNDKGDQALDRELTLVTETNPAVAGGDYTERGRAIGLSRNWFSIGGGNINGTAMCIRFTPGGRIGGEFDYWHMVVDFKGDNPVPLTEGPCPIDDMRTSGLY